MTIPLHNKAVNYLSLHEVNFISFLLLRVLLNGKKSNKNLGLLGQMKLKRISTVSNFYEVDTLLLTHRCIYLRKYIVATYIFQHMYAFYNIIHIHMCVCKIKAIYNRLRYSIWMQRITENTEIRIFWPKNIRFRNTQMRLFIITIIALHICSCYFGWKR